MSHDHVLLKFSHSQRVPVSNEDTPPQRSFNPGKDSIMQFCNTSSVTIGKVEFRPGELLDGTLAIGRPSSEFGLPVFLSVFAVQNAETTGTGWLLRVMKEAHTAWMRAIRTETDPRNIGFSLRVPGKANLDFSLNRAILTNKDLGSNSAFVIGAQ